MRSYETSIHAGMTAHAGIMRIADMGKVTKQSQMAGTVMVK